MLLDTPAFPSALQVFAGVGGLALLAEHLPLLYPEVTRQVTPLEVTKENTSNLGHDWVNVESAEDIYEVTYGHKICLLSENITPSLYELTSFVSLLTGNL